MPNPLTYPVAIELDGIYYISLADDRQFPTYTHSRKIGGAGAAPINITVTLGDSETAPTVGSHIVITVQPQSASRYRTVGGIIMEITQLGSPKRTFQINGLAYEAYLSAVKIPRYSSVNAVTIVTAIEAILTKAYLMGYATDAYDLTTFGDTSATAIVNTDINITAEQAINQVCAQFGFRWYVSTGDWLNKENIGSLIAELVIVKIGYEITGPIDTLDQADIECPPDTMPDVRNVQPTVSIPRPIVVEVASDVESLEAKDQLAELVDVYEIPFLPNSVKRAFIIEIDGVNEVTTVNITSADGSETVSLTINPTPLDPLADPPDFDGFDVLIDTRESRRSILLENDVSSYLASPTTQGFVNGTYTTFRAYGKVTDTTWQGILNTRQVWGDSTTPYFQEQIIEPTAITQAACEALAQSILDAREPYFRKLTFNTTEKGIELLQTITYTNTDLGLSGEKIVITEISENPIDNPDSTDLSSGEIIELSVTCEPVPRLSIEEMAVKQLQRSISLPAERPIAAGMPPHQCYTQMERIAGAGSSDYSGDDGLALNAGINPFDDIAVDPAGNVYFETFTSIEPGSYYGVIRKVTAATGNISQLFILQDSSLVAMDWYPQANALLAVISSSGFNFKIATIDPVTGARTDLSGQGGYGFTPDGNPPYQLLEVVSAVVDKSTGDIIFVERDNVLYVGYTDVRLRKIRASDGLLETIAGTGSAGYSGDGGVALTADINPLNTLAVDSNGQIYFSQVDPFNSNGVKIRRVSNGNISTVVGGGTDESDTVSDALQALVYGFANFTYGGRIYCNSANELLIIDTSTSPTRNRIRLYNPIDGSLSKIAGLVDQVGDAVDNAAPQTNPIAAVSITALGKNIYFGQSVVDGNKIKRIPC